MDDRVNELEMALHLEHKRAEFAFALLREMEWSGDGTHYICPVCRRWQVQGHNTECRLAALLMASADVGQESGHGEEEGRGGGSWGG